MKENKKNGYIVPIVEVMEARIERGFILSSGESASTITEAVTNSGNEYQWT